MKKKVSVITGKTVYLPKKLIEETEKLDFYINDCRSNFSLFVELAIKEKNKRVK